MPLTLTTPENHKKLRGLINTLLKSKLVDEIKRLNYIASYKLIDGKIEKTQEKAFILFFDEKNKDKILGIIKKNLNEFQIIK